MRAVTEWNFDQFFLRHFWSGDAATLCATTWMQFRREAELFSFLKRKREFFGHLWRSRSATSHCPLQTIRTEENWKPPVNCLCMSWTTVPLLMEKRTFRILFSRDVGGSSNSTEIHWGGLIRLCKSWVWCGFFDGLITRNTRSSWERQFVTPCHVLARDNL